MRAPPDPQIDHEFDGTLPCPLRYQSVFGPPGQMEDFHSLTHRKSLFISENLRIGEQLFYSVFELDEPHLRRVLCIRIAFGPQNFALLLAISYDYSAS